MSSIVRKVQHAILTGQSPEKVREALRELQIPAGSPAVLGAHERVRRCILYSGCSEAEMRSAFADLSLTGSGKGDPRQALTKICNSILKN